MRRILFAVALQMFATAAFAQRPVPTPAPSRCCTTKVFDAKGKEIGDVIRWDDRIPSQPLQAVVRYRMAGGDVALVVAPESFSSLQGPGGGVALFTTPDCSGDTMMAVVSWPPLTKRYAMVLPVGVGGSLGFAATNAWLFVTDPLPPRVNPGPGTVFHSQWGDSGACVPFPAPGFTFSPGPWGGFWMHRVEDLLAKYKRPFWAE